MSGFVSSNIALHARNTLEALGRGVGMCCTDADNGPSFHCVFIYIDRRSVALLQYAFLPIIKTREG